MENEIKKLIEKWKDEYVDDDEYIDTDEYINRFVKDLQSLLEFKQKNCCGKQTPVVIKEVYEKFKHLDDLLSDEDWMNPGSHVYNVCYELWKAIRYECT